jgi:hypothetical protein
MLRGLLYFLKLSLYWLIFFTLYRLAFILIYPDKIPEGKYSEALTTFLYGFRLDLATIAYLITIPLILWATLQFFKNNFLNKINHAYNLIMISAITLLCISNIAMYGEWNALINYNTLFYLVAPAKMFPYMTTLELVGVCIGAAVVIAVFVLLFRAMILMVIPYSTTTPQRKLMVVPALFPVVFILMRGGLQSVPINETTSCYSDTKFIDHISVNPVWHLGHMTILALQEPEEENQVGNIQ